MVWKEIFKKMKEIGDYLKNAIKNHFYEILNLLMILMFFIKNILMCITFFILKKMK